MMSFSRLRQSENLLPRFQKIPPSFPGRGAFYYSASYRLFAYALTFLQNQINRQQNYGAGDHHHQS